MGQVFSEAGPFFFYPSISQGSSEALFPRSFFFLKEEFLKIMPNSTHLPKAKTRSIQDS